MSTLRIIGAGGMGRETLEWAMAIPPGSRPWDAVSFLDRRMGVLDAFGLGRLVAGVLEEWQPGPDDLFVCAIGNPKLKLRLARLMEAQGAVFTNVIHPSAVIGSRVRMGAGCVIAPGAVITCDVTIGNHVIVNCHATIGHDASVGDGCVVNCHADITGAARLEEGVLCGSHASVLQGVTARRGSVVGAGSVVVRDVPEGHTVFGSPAKSIFVRGPSA